MALVQGIEESASLGSGYFSERVVVVSDGTLEVRAAQTGDAGNYTCRARNTAGERSRVVGLEVEASYYYAPNSRVTNRHGSGSVINPGGSVGDMRQNGDFHQAVQGHDVILPCPSHGSPPPRLYWLLPGNGVLPAPYYGSRLTVHRNGSLELRAIRAGDGGTLVCVVQGERGEARIQVELSVSGPGGAVELPCLTIATPRATVTWETPDLTQLRVTGQARIYGNRYLSAQGSLVIQNPTSRDTGFYRCTAKNVIGGDSKATYLHVV
ncbi:hypothetical protein CRUP_022417 [Coryphaenoides rupestris]|nr:hypothetical protein CRUP_022417 [Coryphaenoides rupestris]